MAVHKLVEGLMKHKEFIKVTKTEYGILYQLDIIMPKEM